MTLKCVAKYDCIKKNLTIFGTNSSPVGIEVQNNYDGFSQKMIKHSHFFILEYQNFQTFLIYLNVENLIDSVSIAS